MWKGTLIGFILPLGYHSGCVVEKGGRVKKKGDYWMDWIIGSGSLRLCFLVHVVLLGCGRLGGRRELAGGNTLIWEVK